MGTGKGVWTRDMEVYEQGKGEQTEKAGCLIWFFHNKSVTRMGTKRGDHVT